MIPLAAMSSLPLILGVGAYALMLFKDMFMPFKFPEYRAKNPKEVTMLTDKQKKRLPKYARDAIDRLESALAEANAAHAEAVEKGTAEIRRLEARVKALGEAVRLANEGEVGEIRIRRGLVGDFYSRIRVAQEFSSRPFAEGRGSSPHSALSSALRALGRIALHAPSMIRTKPHPADPSEDKEKEKP